MNMPAKAVLTAITVFAILSILFNACGPKPSSKDPALGYYNKAHEYLLKNQPKKAIPLYRKAIDKRANFAQAYHELAACYQQTGDDDKAIENFEGAIVFNPRDVDAYQAVGDIYFAKANYEQALTWYDKAADVNYLRPQTYLNMGTIYYGRQNYDMAKKYFEEAIDSDSTFSVAYYGLGMVAYFQKDTLLAEQKFLDAVRLGHGPEAMYMLGLLYFGQQKFDDARTWLQKYLQKEPSGEWAESSRDMLARINGNNEIK